MKILMITPEPFFKTRGTPISVLQRTKVLSKLGHEVHIVTYHIGEDVRIKNVKIHRIPKVPFIKHISIGPSYRKIILDIFLFFKALLLMLKNRFECVHAHEEAAAMGVIFKSLFKIPLVYDMHSSISQQLVNFNFSRNRYVIDFFKILEKWVLKNSDLIIVICPLLKETAHSYLGKTAVPSKNIVVIENVPDYRDDHEIREERLRNLKEKIKPRGEKIILYTGTFEYYQGIDILVKSIPYVVEKIKLVKFVLVGGEKKQIAEMKKMAKTLNIEEYIKFTGKRPQEEIPTYLMLADVLVSPRRIGVNTPLKIYSYLRAGKPIVATNIAAHTQVLNEDVAILKPPEPKSYAEGIISVITNEELGKKVAREASALFDKKYIYENFVSLTREAYEKVKGLKY